ncbi:hypothetical protein R1flu_007162 [Riccia fluitans]|uniref:Reverse transcriptase domain-containing protein n=1 Tax=Riccia fluitans TaxID=41844 RepID=A0ABD1YYA4_9MARC
MDQRRRCAYEVIFSILKARRTQEEITTLVRDDGTRMEDDDNILEELKQYYQDLYRQPPVSEEDEELRWHILKLMHKRISEAHNAYLIEEPNEEEIEKVIRNLKTEKAPGIDGMTAEVLQFLWRHAPGDVMGFVHKFWETGTLTWKQQTGVIKLISKEGDRQRIKNWRPLTLLNTGKLTDSVLNFLLCQEWAEKRQQEMLFIKLDFEKAYDRVNHKYLWQVMETAGFDPKVIQLTKGLVEGSTSKIHVNGRFLQEFPIERGVKQGCPLAPLLFSLSTETLMALMKKQERDGNLEGLHLTGSKTALYNLFADDSGVFLKASQTNFRNLQQTISMYERISGAKLNLEKLTVIPVGMSSTPQWLKDTGCYIAREGEPIRRFVWGKNAQGKEKIPLLAWEVLQPTKSDGGLDIPSFAVQGEAQKLWQKIGHGDGVCARCRNAMETPEHLLWQCRDTVDRWRDFRFLTEDLSCHIPCTACFIDTVDAAFRGQDPGKQVPFALLTRETWLDRNQVTYAQQRTHMPVSITLKFAVEMLNSLRGKLEPTTKAAKKLEIAREMLQIAACRAGESENAIELATQVTEAVEAADRDEEDQTLHSQPVCCMCREGSSQADWCPRSPNFISRASSCPKIELCHRKWSLAGLPSGKDSTLIQQKNPEEDNMVTEPKGIEMRCADVEAIAGMQDFTFLFGANLELVLSRLVFSWVEGLLAIGSKRPLQCKDLPPMSIEDDAAYNYNEFSVHWENQKRKTPAGSPPSLWAAVMEDAPSKEEKIESIAHRLQIRRNISDYYKLFVVGKPSIEEGNEFLGPFCATCKDLEENGRYRNEKFMSREVKFSSEAYVGLCSTWRQTRVLAPIFEEWAGAMGGCPRRPILSGCSFLSFLINGLAHRKKLILGGGALDLPMSLILHQLGMPLQRYYEGLYPDRAL